MTTNNPNEGVPTHDQPAEPPQYPASSYTPHDRAEYLQYPHYSTAQYPVVGPQGGYQPGQYGYGFYSQPAPAPTKRSARRGALAGGGAAIVAAMLVIGGVAYGRHEGQSVQGSGTSVINPGSGTANGGGTGSGTGSGGTGSGGTGTLPNLTPGGTSGGSGTSGTSTGTAASTTQKIGVVTIVSVLKYQNAESAGTGTIMTSNGEILTNNHVVNGATSITVTVQSTGTSYKASVVGTAPTKDIAVLQLKNASGLTTAKYASSASSVAVGDAVTGVGNAGGTGSLSAAAGKVTGLNKSITATDDSGQEAERLHDLIQIDAPIIAGDSGGPLYNSSGDVVGIDTAASTSQGTDTAKTAYAIRIDDAMALATQIESGVQTTTIHIGLPGFLGVGLATSGGLQVSTVMPGGPAAAAGLASGATITGVNGTKVTSSTALHDLLAKDGPGKKISISWTDAAGASHTKTVTLATGPAD
jgi:S1-C subfamily serine protease